MKEWDREIPEKKITHAICIHPCEMFEIRPTEGMKSMQSNAFMPI